MVILLVTIIGIAALQSQFRTGHCVKSLDHFLPYGPQSNDTTLAIDDYEDATLETPFKLFGTFYSVLTVNTKGGLSYSYSLGGVPTCGATDNPSIIPFWAGVVTSLGDGAVYYRESYDPWTLARVSDDVKRHFNIEFSPLALFIATWDRVTFSGCCVLPTEDCPANTFQTATATNGAYSFVYINYGEMNWFGGSDTGQDCATGNGGEYAPKAGLDQGDQLVWYSLPGSCNYYITEIADTTNIGTEGAWMFRVDTTFQEACPGGGGSGSDHGDDNGGGHDGGQGGRPGRPGRPGTGASYWRVGDEKMALFDKILRGQHENLEGC